MKLLFALVALLCVLQFAEAGRSSCRVVPVYKYYDHVVCKPTRVAPFTKVVITKTPYTVYVPHVTSRTVKRWKTVCYNKKYRQAYRLPVRATRKQRYTIQQRYRYSYSMKESYRVRETARRRVRYLHSYSRLVTQRYNKRVGYWYYYNSRQSYTAVRGCSKLVGQAYYVRVRTPYKSTCRRRSFVFRKKAFRGTKRVRFRKKVWTGRWTHDASKPNCHKKLYKYVWDSKLVPTIVWKRVKVSVLKRSPCIKHKWVRTRRVRQVRKYYNCRKWRTVRRRVRRTKLVPATRKVRKTFKVWRTKTVSYTRWGMRSRTVRKWMYSYKSKVVVRVVPYYRYTTAYRNAYKLAHKRVSYNYTYQVVGKRRATRYRMGTKVVSVNHVKRVCRTHQRKRQVGNKRICLRR